MSEHTAVVIGASGLVGSNLVELLLNDNYFDLIRVLVRKKLTIDHPKLKQQIIDFNNIDDYSEKFGTGEIIFSCIGTTQKNVGRDKSAYEKIDHDIPVNAAALGVAKGFKKILIVSSVGANISSSTFYLQLKGRTEKDIQNFNFESISFFRPSMLLGERTESRPFEKLLQNGISFLSHFFIGPLKKYHSMSSKDLAKAMITQSKKDDPGTHILEYEQILNLIT